MPKPLKAHTVFSGFSVLFGFGFTYNLIRHYGFRPNTAQPFEVQVSDIGTQMLSTAKYGYVLPFEVVSILLLSAMIGCIVIAMKSKPAGLSVDKSVRQQGVKIEEIV